MRFLIDNLENWAAVQPNKCVSSFIDIYGQERSAYTYAEFSSRTRDLAEYLSRQAGLQFGDRVLLAYPPGLDLVLAFFACVRIGVIPVPIPPPTSVNFEAGLAKLTFIAQDCQARSVLTTREYRRSYQLLLAGRHTSSPWKTPGIPPGLEWVITDDAKERASGAFRNDPNPVLFLQYTSGSTSEPKGVIVSHENVIHNAMSTMDHAPICVSWLPQYHDMGLIGCYLFPIITGGTTYGLSALDFLKRPILWLQTMTRVRATCASSPNFGFDYCLREDKVSSAQLRDIDLSSVRVLMNAAEPVRVDTYVRFRERFSACGLRPDAYVVAYGLAENTLAATSSGRRFAAVDKQLAQQGILQIEDAEHGSDRQLRIASCGKPLAGIHLRIVNPQSGAVLGERQIGEIWLSGTSVCDGYWERPELTRQVFKNVLASDPQDDRVYLKTGDLGFLLDGELYVCGRVKDLIIIRGVNYYPQDIEAIVESASPRIRPGCVAAFNGGGEEETLVVMAEIKAAKAPPDPAMIAHAIRTRCYVAPHTIIFVPARTIVKTSSGKIARSLTRQRWLNGELPSIATHVFVTEQAHQVGPSGLRERFRHFPELHSLTGREDCTIGELGMDSLSLVQFATEIKDLLRKKGAAEVLGEVDIQLLQKLTVSDFFQLLDQFERLPGQAVAVWSGILTQAQNEYNSHVLECMRSDARMEPYTGPGLPPRSEHPRNVLLTGSTGFFGPFLLGSLLRQTPYTYYVLIRASDAAHGMDRIRESLRRSRIWTTSLAEELEKRVHIVCGDISQRNLGLRPEQWEALTSNIHAVCHNAALVNYVLNYETLRPHNVDGTRELLRFSLAGRRKEFHHISSTFIFGWTVKGCLLESDNNDEMMNLDFGYAQTKWVAEQLVFGAERQGLKVRVYRPSLISASTHGVWDRDDIALRLLAFMINHGVAVQARNQISFLPADIVADNIASIFGQREIPGRTFHVTADAYYNMTDITRLITGEYGCQFIYHEIPEFVAEMNRLCTRDEPLYPLLDFFNRTFEKIAAMQLKRYNNDQYQEAKKQSSAGRSDPPLKDTVSYLMSYMLQNGFVRAPGMLSGANDGAANAAGA